MPAISMFFGIVITMNWADREPPHFHARYSGYKASYILDGRRSAGTMPVRQERMILAWLEIHRDELMANWELARDNQQLFRIDPLSQE